jgi:predicted membrane-bound spermidine synthase
LILPTFAFLISGASALGYQICWQRLLVVFAGGDIQAITIIVATFMLGLGAGALASGWLADQISVKRSLCYFAGIECLIGLWGSGSKWLYYDILCQQLSHTIHFRPTSTFLIMLALLPPTVLMGLSLPLLTRGVTKQIRDAAAHIGWLYGINTVGAAAGAIITTWVLLPQHGIEDSLSIAALGNMLCTLLVLPLIANADHATSIPPAPCDTDVRAPLSAGFIRYLALYATTGFLALGLEMMWFRVLGVMIKSTAFTFGTLISFYLAGLGLGSLLGTFWVRRSTRPLQTFLWLQASLALLAASSLVLVLQLVHHSSWLSNLRDYLGSYEPVDVNSTIAEWRQNGLTTRTALLPQLYLLVPLFLIGPATLLMGLSFPFLQKAVQNDPAQMGRRLGWLQASNIVGSVLGTILVSWLLLPLLGSAGTLKWLVLIGAVLGAVALSSKAGVTRLQKGVWAGVSLIVFLIMPGRDALWALIHDTSPEKLTHIEDSSGLAVLKRVDPSPDSLGDTVIFVNGIGQSWLPYGGIHSLLGALPALLHPRPEHIAIIGLGSGDTAYSAAARYETEKVFCIEIVEGQLQSLKNHAKKHATASLNALLTEDRIHHIPGDGRRFLKMTSQRFDIIEADALRPNSAGSGNLYSEEYFRLVSRRLKPGGYAVTWAPTSRVRSTFIRVFPHVLDLGVLLIGSLDPIQASADDLRRRLGHLEIRDHFRRAGIPIREQLAAYTQVDYPAHLIGPKFDRSKLGEINTDLFPRDEFHLPALFAE